MSTITTSAEVHPVLGRSELLNQDDKDDLLAVLESIDDEKTMFILLDGYVRVERAHALVRRLRRALECQAGSRLPVLRL